MIKTKKPVKLPKNFGKMRGDNLPDKKPKAVKIKLPNTEYFVEVVLHNSVDELKKKTKDKEAAGLYHPEPYVIYPKLKIKPKLGTIHLAKEKLGVGYISHEVLHCIFDWWDKVYHGRALENHDDQEKACWYQGYIIKEICNWLNENKSW